MNLFYFDEDHKTNARYHCDKHITKMPTEVAQLLSTAVRILAREQGIDLPAEVDDQLYRETHRNHPCAIWVRSDIESVLWAVEYGEALCTEYEYRYGREHAARRVIGLCDGMDTYHGLTPVEGPQPHPQAMPEQYRIVGDPVTAYRNYFNGEKQYLASWTNRPVPSWFRPKPTEVDVSEYTRETGCTCDKDAVYQINPYAQEIHGVEQWEWMCKSCYMEALADI
jgi:hypothetical protein